MTTQSEVEKKEMREKEGGKKEIKKEMQVKLTRGCEMRKTRRKRKKRKKKGKKEREKERTKNAGACVLIIIATIEICPSFVNVTE